MAVKQNETVNPQTQGDDDDFYDDASSAFPKVEHLAPSVPPKFGPGRLLAIWVQAAGKRKNDRGEFYPYVETVTVTLDDGPEGLSAPGWPDEAAATVPAGVQRLDKFQHSTSGLVARLERRLTARNPKGVLLKYRPMIGRINTQASSANKNVAAYSISEPTEADRAVIEAHKAMIIAINHELEAADKQAEDDKAFD